MWYPVADGVPALGIPSIINSLDWDSSPWERSGVGEVWGASRKYNGKQAIPGIGRDHVCGTADNFARGESITSSLPPTVYNPQGVPLCCNPPKIMEGAITISGDTENYVLG